MKLYNLNKWVAMFIAIFIIITVSCNKDDDTATSGELSAGDITLEVFGPSPSLRGDTISFIGVNMNKVTAVVFPDELSVTDINVVSSEKITVVIPDDAEVGYLTLETPNGDITTKTKMEYTEPVSIDTIYPGTVKAGETLTIEGTYLNLMDSVIFTDGVSVSSDNYTTWERTKIQLVVPYEAQTGTITLTDTAGTTTVEYEYEIEVTLPSVSSVTALTDIKPEDEISLEGEDLDLVESVTIPDGTSVDFTVSDNTISFTIPTGTTDGTISMVAYSGVSVSLATITMAVPTDLTASPATGIYAGDVITISGTDMDLVTSVTFPGLSDETSLSSSSSTEITVVMPDDATSGDITLNTASGNTATVAIETQKPEVTSYSPSSVAIGNDVTLSGTDLDLVTSVTFTNDQEVEVTAESSTSLTVTVPEDAETGELILTMSNGETVTCSSLTITSPEYCYTEEDIESSTDIYSDAVLSFEVENGDVLTDVLIDNTSTQYILSGTTLYVLIPEDASGTAELTLVSSNGEVSYTLTIYSTETVIYTGPLDLTWSSGGRVWLESSYFESLSAGDVMKIYFTQMDDWGQAQINNGSWSTISFDELGKSGYMTTDTYGDKSVTEQELVLTETILDNINTYASDGYGIIIQGQNWTIDEISIIKSSSTSTSSISKKDFLLKLK